MNTKFLRSGVLIAILIATFGMMTGCEQAEQAMEKTDLGASSDLTKLMGKAAELLGGIKDIDSAKAALPALQGMDVDLGKIVSKVSEMTPEQKSQLTSVVTKAMPQLEGAITKVSSMPGVGAIVGPTLESFKNKFKSMM